MGATEIELEAAVANLMEDMEGAQGDAHEIHQRLRQILDQMRATGMPPPADLVRLEKELDTQFARDAAQAKRKG